GGAVVTRRYAQLLLDLLLHLGGHVDVLPQEPPGVLLALSQLRAVVGVPGTGLTHDAVFDPQVDEASLAGNPHTVQNIEFCLFERRRCLVLHNSDAGTVSHRVGAFLQCFDAPNIQTNRGIELQCTPTGGRFGAVVHHDTVDEVIMVAFDLDIEFVCVLDLRIDMDVQDLGGHETLHRLGEHRFDLAPVLKVRQQLVGHAVGDVGRHQFLEPIRGLGGEPGDVHLPAFPGHQLDVQFMGVPQVVDQTSTASGAHGLDTDVEATTSTLGPFLRVPGAAGGAIVVHVPDSQGQRCELLEV